MSLKALTANTAPEENAHLLAEDDAAIFQSMFGEDGVLEIGQRMKATVISNNKVRVADGVVCIGGHIARTVYGDYTDLTIENGESGKNRNDLIIGTFSTTGAGGIDTMQLTVKKGAAGTAATDPALTQGNLYTGSKLREVPLWRVKIEGLSITKVEQLFEIVPSIPTLKKELESLNGKIEKPILYSATEKQIGVTDSGEPVYQKTIRSAMTYFSKPSSGYTDCTISVGAYLKKILRADAHIVKNDNTEMYALPYSATGGSWGTWLKSISSSGSQQSVLHFYNNVTWGSAYTLVVTIDYTK